MQTQTLFERLGGSRGITALVDDIVAAHMDNRYQREVPTLSGDAGEAGDNQGPPLRVSRGGHRRTEGLFGSHDV
jgi:hypothetical protein